MAVIIKKAVRERLTHKIAIAGPAGAGKSWAAVRLALGLADEGQRVIVINTEHMSTQYLADMWDFDEISLTAPFTVEKYREAFQAAIAAGYKVIVIDSISHEWAGPGGILEEKAMLDKRGGNGYTNWQEYKAKHGSFVEEVLAAKAHVIVTMRSKMAYDLVEYTEKGKTMKKPVKRGMEPIQIDGIEYEFGVVFDLEVKTHTAESTKDRTGIFSGRTVILDESVGRELKAWADGGAAPQTQTQPTQPQPQPVSQAPAQATPTQAPPIRTPEQRTEDKRDEFVNDTQFVSDADANAIMELVIKYQVPLDRFMSYLMKVGAIVPDGVGEARIERLLDNKAAHIHDILADGKRRYAFVTALQNETATKTKSA